SVQRNDSEKITNIKDTVISLMKHKFDGDVRFDDSMNGKGVINNDRVAVIENG
ncbi:23147_t:CDS:2, partial [Gigaspora rosea]